MRQNPVFRRMIRETRLSPDDLIYPMFVVEGRGEKKPISAMPGQFQLSVDEIAVNKAKAVFRTWGCPSVILFGIAG